MVKSFLILVICHILLHSSEQIILVVSNDFNSNEATLSCFDDGKKVFETIDVNIGKNGLGWGLGKTDLIHIAGEPLKYEGDNKAPVGIFKLVSIFGYEKNLNFKMPYLHATKELICVDDSDSTFYNKIIHIGPLGSTQKPNSFEYMRRDDKQYELGIVVAHNENQVKKRGSCIFLHVQKSQDTPTAGCTSMSLKNIKRIVNWLDKSKNPILIQVPIEKLDQVKKLYPKIKYPQLHLP